VPIIPAAHQAAIYIDLEKSHDAIKVEVKTLTRRLGGDVQSPAAPALAPPGKLAGAAIAFGIKGARDGPVVRDMYRSPVLIV